MAKIQITDLALRTIIGTNDWERKTKQDITINISLEYNSAKARASDRLEDAIDYKRLTKRIIQEVENSHFFLLEALSHFVLKIIMEDKRIKRATVRIDKPQALRFAKSVSIELSGRDNNPERSARGVKRRGIP